MSRMRAWRDRWVARWYFPYFLERKERRIGTGSGRLSRPFVRVAVGALGVSVAAMVVALSVAKGFQREIGERTVGFVGHIQVVNLDMNASYEQRPIVRQQPFLPAVRNLPGVLSVGAFGVKAGIVKTADQMQGCVLKGVDSTRDLDFFTKYLQRGHLPDFTGVEPSLETMISESFAKALFLDTGQDVVVYFVERPPRVRKFHIVGVYDTQMHEFDMTYLYCDLRHIQQLNDWGADRVGGYEVRVGELEDLDRVYGQVEDLCTNELQPDGTLLQAVDVREKYSTIFDWLALQDINVAVLLTLILLVAGVNMVTALLILILERTWQIGLLKALGATNGQIRRLFLLKALRILIWGLVIGNAVGVGICLAQHYWHFARLNPEEYYMDHVPVLVQGGMVLLVNAGVVLVTLLMLLIPSGLLARVSPVEAMRME